MAEAQLETVRIDKNALEDGGIAVGRAILRQFGEKQTDIAQLDVSGLLALTNTYAEELNHYREMRRIRDAIMQTQEETLLITEASADGKGSKRGVSGG